MRLREIARLPDGAIMVQGTATALTAYTIEATPSLVEPFTPICTATADAEGHFTLHDPAVSSFSQRFYRAARVLAPARN